MIFVATPPQNIEQPAVGPTPDGCAERAAKQFDLPVSALEIKNWKEMFAETTVEANDTPRVWRFDHNGDKYFLHESFLDMETYQKIASAVVEE